MKSQLIHKDLDAGKYWRPKEKWAAEDERLESITDSMNLSLSKLWETVEDGGVWCAAAHEFAKSQTCLETKQQQ